MLSPARNRIETEQVIIEPVEDFSVFAGFCCGDEDLDDFILNAAQPHQEQLLAKSYVLRMKMDDRISSPVAFASISNDVVSNMPTSRKKKKFAQRKRYPDFPAVKIGRLGVDSRFQKKGIGQTLIGILTSMFVTQNRTGCRFVTLDAYRDAIPFYEKCGFEALIKKDLKGTDATVLMYLDLQRVDPIDL